MLMQNQPPPFPFPKTSEHTTILGRTGSGKSHLGAWLLSHSDFDQMPFIIFDYKGDELLNSLGATNISITAEPPDKPGLYIVHLIPEKDDEAREAFLWKIHARGRAGIYVDEGFNFANSNALDTILMQGRSKEIPCYINSQRPSWISRYCFSEASHFVLFHLNDRRDRVKVREFFDAYQEARLPQFHAQWYAVNQDKNFLLPPVSSSDKIRARFTERLAEMRDKHISSRFY